jgi:hypothetical protein
MFADGHVRALMIRMYIKLCTDDTPMVRRAVCANTGVENSSYHQPSIESLIITFPNDCTHRN